MSSPKLPTARGIVLLADDRDPAEVAIRLPGNMFVSYSRQEIMQHTHASISPELAEVKMKEADAKYAEPARQQTRQVIVIGGTFVLGLIICLAFMTAIPAQATAIAGMFGTITVVLGGVYALQTRQKAKALPRNTSED